MSGVSTTRLYGASIALVSGAYALIIPISALLSQQPMGGMAAGSMGLGGWAMAVLGVVVIGHGLVLLTPYARRPGRASGPLMIVWATLMLLNQLLLVTTADAMTQIPDEMGWDPGMVAIAALMLISGLIMTGRSTEMSM